MNSVQKRLCDDLNISSATVANWVKTKVISPLDKIITEQDYNVALENIYKTQKLNNRANRLFQKNKFTTYLGIKNKTRRLLLDEIIKNAEKSCLSTDALVLALALQQLKSENLLEKGTKIEKFCSSWLCTFCEETQAEINAIFQNYFIQNEDDDFLGAFYQSIQSIGQKSKKGAFYTPSELLTDISFPVDKKVYDPCCGSGSVFLGTLSKSHQTNLIYGSDIDLTSLKICRINLAMFFHNPDTECNLFENDIFRLPDETSKKEFYDYIITNPPWGAKFSQEQKKMILSVYPELETTESFSVALHNCLKLISRKGNISFFLPYSFLNVASHRKIREEIIEQQNSVSIKLLGHSFKGVLSESLLLNVDYSKEEKTIKILRAFSENYELAKEKIESPDFIITAQGSELADLIIDKVYSVKYITLKKNAIFALGIVTGNNGAFLRTEKNANDEMIFKGKNIFPFKIKDSNFHISFTPQVFQQVAPEKYYRSKKVVYRFISKKIICCLDCEKRLLLNSANLFIPTCDYPCETIICLFNSSVYNFIFQKKFHSAKILKSHLETLPLPILSSEQHEMFFQLHTKFSQGDFLQDELDRMVAALFQITNAELAYIQNEINN